MIMIKIEFKKLENNNLEITEKMLNDILSHMKRQDELIERLKPYRDFIYNVIITPENWNSKETGYELHSHTKQELYENLYILRNRIIEEKGDDNDVDSD